MNFETLWTANDVADYLRMSVSWVYKAAERGDIPGQVRIGNRLRFDPHAIRRELGGDTGPRQPTTLSRIR